MGAAPPTWWCPTCLSFRFTEDDVHPLVIMVTLQEYQDRWGMGDYRIDSSDADDAFARWTSGHRCSCDPFLSVLNRIRLESPEDESV